MSGRTKERRKRSDQWRNCSHCHPRGHGSPDRVRRAGGYTGLRDTKVKPGSDGGSIELDGVDPCDLWGNYPFGLARAGKLTQRMGGLLFQTVSPIVSSQLTHLCRV